MLQGSALGPSLFLALINGLAAEIKSISCLLSVEKTSWVITRIAKYKRISTSCVPDNLGGVPMNIEESISGETKYGYSAL